MAKLGFNRVVLIGEVERASYRLGASGRPRLWFKLHSRMTEPDEDGVERVRDQWNGVVVFGAQASALRPYVMPGARVAVEGRLATTSFDHAGQRKYRTEVHAASVVLVSTPPSAAA